MAKPFERIPLELESPLDLYLHHWKIGVYPAKALIKLFVEHPDGVRAIKFDLACYRQLMKEVRSEGKSGSWEQQQVEALKVLLEAVRAAKP